MDEHIRAQETALSLIQGDITKVTADIIVNAANTSLLGGGGVDGAIHRAGGPEILEACMDIRRRQGGCPVGEAILTTAGRLPASYVIHTVGPVWNGGFNSEEAKLRSCYTSTLALASRYHAKSMAFPNISTGIYRFPKELAAEVALESVTAYLREAPSEQLTLEQIYFVCWDEENYRIYLDWFEGYTETSEL